MPGEDSLRARQYYAHPRNAFWPIMGMLFDVPLDAPYEKRLRALKTKKVALWDVIHSCKRKGSLDARIESSSVILNDLATFIARHKTLRAVAFNGRKSETLFRRNFADVSSHLKLIALPSTSPAHASLSVAAKCDRWRVLLRFLERN
jgi:hypoxanthine-DNA glycosylase